MYAAQGAAVALVDASLHVVIWEGERETQEGQRSAQLPGISALVRTVLGRSKLHVTLLHYALKKKNESGVAPEKHLHGFLVHWHEQSPLLLR